MIRSSLFAAASVLVLAACQPAAETSEDSLVAETPPVAEETVDVAEPTADAEEGVETIEVATTDADEDAHDHDDHSEDGHDEDEHDHEGHNHEDEHEGHDHDDDHADDHEGHDHDNHDNHDHAGGEAHVHGLTEMAVAIDGNTVSVSFDGALANFDLDESIRTLDDTSPYTDGVITLVGGACAQDGATATIRPIGDHGNLMVDLTYTCAEIGSLEAIDVNAFEQFAGFEEVNAVALNEADQSAATLTASSGRIDLR